MRFEPARYMLKNVGLRIRSPIGWDNRYVWPLLKLHYCWINTNLQHFWMLVCIELTTFVFKKMYPTKWPDFVLLVIKILKFTNLFVLVCCDCNESGLLECISVEWSPSHTEYIIGLNYMYSGLILVHWIQNYLKIEKQFLGNINTTIIIWCVYVQLIFRLVKSSISSSMFM